MQSPALAGLFVGKAWSAPAGTPAHAIILIVELKPAAQSRNIKAFVSSEAFMHKDRLLQISFLATMALLVADSAFAQYNTPCTGDGRRLCGTRNAAVAEPCLRQHLDELSPACKAYLAKKQP